MHRKTLHIVLLVVLGLYYNGASAVWLAYSTFAKDFFIERCENPTKSCCQGKCQVAHIEDKTGTSDRSSSKSIQIVDLQPTITSAFVLGRPIQRSKIVTIRKIDIPLLGILSSPFHPPRA